VAIPWTTSSQQRVIAEFQRRRRNQMLAAIPILAGTLVLCLLYRQPRYEIAGFGGANLAMAAGVVLAVGLVLHYRVWRCPACGRHLGGRNTGFCRSCGALFLSK
jgi:hypothetical protein